MEEASRTYLLCHYEMIQQSRIFADLPHVVHTVARWTKRKSLRVFSLFRGARPDELAEQWRQQVNWPINYRFDTL